MGRYHSFLSGEYNKRPSAQYKTVDIHQFKQEHSSAYQRWESSMLATGALTAEDIAELSELRVMFDADHAVVSIKVVQQM